MSGCSNFYGNIANVETTGASQRTAKPEGLSYAGVAASEKIAERDLKNMDKYKETITKVANSKCIPPSLVAAVISRESHAGTALKDGWGDHGNAFGLMQVDKRYHKPHGAWDSEEHIKQGTDILCQSITDIQKKFPTWSKEQQLKGNMVHSWALITAAVIIMVGPFISNYDTNISDDINITKGSNTTTEDVRFAKRQRSPSLDVNHNFLTMLKRKWNTSVMETAENGGISAYNAGTRNVRTYEGMDVGTTHDDYANDVVARAKFFQRNGY